MLYTLELSFQNIGRFIEKQTIDFSKLADFIQVDAVNKNTGGSSGSGKTTVFKALEYLLGLNDDSPATVLQSRFTEEAIAVSGKFKYCDNIETKFVAISRIKGKIRVEYGDGVIIQGSNAKCEEEIDKLIGMPRDLFRKILHKRQKEGGFFIDMTASQKHDFLIDCLNLGEMRKKDKVLDERLKTLEKERQKHEQELAAADAGLAATNDGILALGPKPVQDMHREVIIELKAKLDKVEAEYHKVMETCRLELDTLMLTKPDVSVLPFDTIALDQYQKEKRDIEDIISSSLQAEKDRIAKVKVEIAKIQSTNKDLNYKVALADSAQKKALEIASEIKKIRACSCPTCEQQWNTEASKAHENRLMKDLAQLKETISFKAQASAQVAENEGLLADLQAKLQGQVDPRSPEWHERLHAVTSSVVTEKKKQQEHLDSQNSTNRLILSVFEEKRQQLLEKTNSILQQAKGTVEVNRRTLDMAVSKLQAYESAKKRYDDSLAAMNVKQKSLTEQQSKCSLALEQVKNEIELAEELRKCIKMYLSRSFDDALDSIGAKATEIIRCIPNMSNATIQFESTRETKDGKVKEEVNAVIGMDGEVGIPIKSLSGGERSAVDLAVDLAVIDFIESKSAKGSDLFILDEPFTGLGTIEIEMALEVLKNSNTNKKLIIVDHNPEVKQMVQSRIVVERTGTTSKIAS